MEILGIGLPELVFIIILALILINPKDMRSTGLTFGRMLNRIITSPFWQTMREIQKMPTQLMRDANLEEFQQSIGSIGNASSKIPVARTLPHLRAPKSAMSVESAGYATLPSPAVESTSPDSPPETPAPA